VKNKLESVLTMSTTLKMLTQSTTEFSTNKININNYKAIKWQL
jgi:hypothetical protein